MMKKLVLAALVLAGCTSEAQTKADAIKAEVAAKMKDPDSAKFTNLKFRLATLCGEVNAKNSFGGYAGAEQFYGSPGLITLRSEVEKIDAKLAGTRAARINESAVSIFNESYKRCQDGGEAVS